MAGIGFYNPTIQQPSGGFVVTSQNYGGMPPVINSNPDYFKNGPAVYPPLYNDLNTTGVPSYNQFTNQAITIDLNSFNILVPVVMIDKKGRFNDQNTCIICANYFVNEEIRQLPCKHAFHGKCLYEMMFVRNHKVCPICKFQYY